MNADPVWTAACAREVDELSIGTFGIRQTDLMERAGTAVANIARSASRGKSFLVLAAIFFTSCDIRVTVSLIVVLAMQV